MAQLSHQYRTTGKTIALIKWSFVSKMMSLLFNMLFRFIMGFSSVSDGKISVCNSGNSGSILGGRYSGVGNDNHQYSYLEIFMGRGGKQATVHGLQGVEHDWVTLQSPSPAILKTKLIKTVTVSSFYHLFAIKWWNWMPWS